LLYFATHEDKRWRRGIFAKKLLGPTGDFCAGHAHPKADDCFDILSNLQQRGDLARLSDNLIGPQDRRQQQGRNAGHGWILCQLCRSTLAWWEANHVRPLSTNMRDKASTPSPDWNRARRLPCPGQARPRRQRPPMPLALEIFEDSKFEIAGRASPNPFYFDLVCDVGKKRNIPFFFF
jgi:hypothetical protein